MSFRRTASYVWFNAVMGATRGLPDLTVVLRLRGALVRPCFKRCGKNLQIASNVEVTYTTHVDVGDDVFLGRGAWLMGYGGITLEDQAMLGPYTVLAASNHTKKDRSYRFGPPTGEPIVLGRGVWMGAHAVVTQGVTIGAGSAIAAGAVVTRDIPSDAVAGGVPAKVLGSKPTELRPSIN
mgnify:CR=1 FL=1